MLGASCAFVLTFVHRQFPVPVFGIEIPLGLIGGLLIVTALFVGFRLVFDDRWATAGAALGVVGASSLLALPGAGGSLLVLGDPAGYVWAFAPVGIALVVLAWPSRRGVAAPERAAS